MSQLPKIELYDDPAAVMAVKSRFPRVVYERKLTLAWLRGALGRMHGECTWCGSELPGRRLIWCSDRCYTEADFWSGRTETAHRYATEFLDYKCDSCGAAGERWEFSPRRKVGTKLELDHIVPVSEGGGLCGLGNYRWLCVTCHRQETRALRKRLAR